MMRVIARLELETLLYWIVVSLAVVYIVFNLNPVYSTYHKNSKTDMILGVQIICC